VAEHVAAPLVGIEDDNVGPLTHKLPLLITRALIHATPAALKRLSAAA